MMAITSSNISVVLPAKNEAVSLGVLLPEIRKILPECEIIVVDDGSDDNTGEVARKHADLVVRHQASLGNGAAIKAGARAAGRDYFLFMDADGQHKPSDIPALLDALKSNGGMVVGARKPSSHASIMRRLANAIYNRLATYMTGQEITDLTSGFRVVEAGAFRRFMYLLPNGFSYPTTITMALSRAGLPLTYIPIEAGKREGNSHIQPVRDGIRFLLIIFKIGSLYSPLKLYFPASFICFAVGLAYYTYTYITDGRFTNMGVLLFITSLLVFILGLISEQITVLTYSQNREDQ